MTPIDFDRIPRVNAIAPVSLTPTQMLRSRWSWRHTVATVLLAPLSLWSYAAASSTPPSGPFSWVVLAVSGVLAALVLASFVPVRGGGGVVPRSTCGTTAGLMPFLAFVPLGQDAAVLVPLLLAFALNQRLFGAGNCGV